MGEIKEFYATKLEKGFNINKDTDEKIHVHYEPEYINSHKVNKIELLDKLDYYFIVNKYLSKEEYEAILKSLLY